MKKDVTKNDEIINNKKIGIRIRQERERLALTRADFAEIVGLSDYYVGQLERGERQMSLPVLIKISICLSVSMDYLIFGTTIYNNYSSGDEDVVTSISENEQILEIHQLIKKCSHSELDLIKKLIQTVLPYIIPKVSE